MEQGELAALAARMWRDIADLGDRLIAALADVLRGTDSGRIRPFVAAMVIGIDRLQCGILSDEALLEAEACLEKALASDEDVLAALCALGHIAEAPDSLLPQVRARVSEGDPDLRIAALCALVRYLRGADSRDWERLNTTPAVLAGQLVAASRNGPMLRTVAAMYGLAMLGKCEHEHLQWLIDAIDDSNPNERAALVSLAGSAGRGSAMVVDYLLAALEKEASSDLQFSLGQALGSAAPVNRMREVALRVNEHSEAATPGFVLGASDACAEQKEVQELITEWPSSSDDTVRCMATIVAGQTHSTAIRLWPWLVERIGLELSFEIALHLASAIGTAGSVAAEAVVAKFRTGNIAAFQVAAMALGCMGRGGVKALVAELRYTQDMMVRGAMMTCFRDWGAHKLLIAVELARHLEEEREDVVRYFLLAALKSMGAGAAPALPQVISALVHGEGDVASEAESVIGAIGVDAVPYVEEALESCPEDRRERLIVLIGWLAKHDRSLWVKFRGLSDEELIGFLCAGEACIKARGSLSFRDMAKALEPLKENGLVGSGRNHDWIKEVFDRMQERIKGRPIRKLTAKVTTLTPRGRSLIGQLRVYLHECGLVGRFRES